MDDNSVTITVDDAKALLTDVQVEANYGAQSGDPMLARNSRASLAMVTIVLLILEKMDDSAVLARLDAVEAAHSDNTVTQRLETLETKVNALVIPPDLTNELQALENRVAAIPAPATDSADANGSVAAADADIQARTAGKPKAIGAGA